MLQTTPLITIVLPFLNRGELLRKTLQSISAQKDVPRVTDILLVDNGSTDIAPEVAIKWMAKECPDWAKVKLINAERRGAAVARNQGLEYVTTPWVMFFDSDDIMMPFHLAEVHKAVENYPDADIIHWTVTVEGREASYIKRAKLQRDDIDVVMHCVWGTQRYVVKREFLKKCGDWDEETQAWDDWELGVRLFLNNPSAISLSGMNTVKIVYNADSITGINFSQKEGRWEKALEKAAVQAKNNGRDDIYFLINAKKAILAADYKREGNEKAAQKLLDEIKADKALYYPLLSLVHWWRKKLVKGTAVPLPYLIKMNRWFTKGS